MKTLYCRAHRAATLSSPAFAQVNTANIIDMELLTHTELSQKLKDGWTSVSSSPAAPKNAGRRTCSAATPCGAQPRQA